MPHSDSASELCETHAKLVRKFAYATMRDSDARFTAQDACALDSATQKLLDLTEADIGVRKQLAAHVRRVHGGFFVIGSDAEAEVGLEDLVLAQLQQQTMMARFMAELRTVRMEYERKECMLRQSYERKERKLEQMVDDLDALLTHIKLTNMRHSAGRTPPNQVFDRRDNGWVIGGDSEDECLPMPPLQLPPPALLHIRSPEMRVYPEICVSAPSAFRPVARRPKRADTPQIDTPQPDSGSVSCASDQ